MKYLYKFIVFIIGLLIGAIGGLFVYCTYFYFFNNEELIYAFSFAVLGGFLIELAYYSILELLINYLYKLHIEKKKNKYLLDKINQIGMLETNRVYPDKDIIAIIMHINELQDNDFNNKDKIKKNK